VAASNRADKSSAAISSTHQSSSEARENFDYFTGGDSFPISSGCWSMG
jgi:hypothetical protein